MILKETKACSLENLFNNITMVMLITLETNSINNLILSAMKKTINLEISIIKLFKKIRKAPYSIRMMMTKSKLKKTSLLNLKEIT